MGFWSSTQPSARPKEPSQKDEQQPRPPAPEPVSARTLSRGEQAELELQAFLSGLNSDGTRSTKTAASSPPSSTARSSSTATASPSESSISPDALLPTDMSCREAFDSAFYCQSPGGQFLNVYRYGGLKDCSGHWGAFWFCMRLKGFTREERQRKVQGFYRQRAAKYKSGPSSEDVWETRLEPVVDAFNQDLPSESTAREA